MKTIELRSPYLIFVGDAAEDCYAKTGFGLVQWRRELCQGQLSLAGGSVDVGLPPMTLKQAASSGVGSLIIGTAAIGGTIPEGWLDTLVAAADLGIDIVAGVHTRLNNIPRLSRAAERSGARLIDVRVPPAELSVGTGRKRPGRRLLTVGTDCAVGKKYSALALEQALHKAGMKATFRASGQTGIMIAGAGIPIDAVVADFISGAAEALSPDNDPDHWDVIEGQGSIFHPGYCAVSMGLLVGSQPEAFVVCHEAGRTHILGWDNFKLPSVDEVIARTLILGRQTNPAIRCVGVSVNTSALAPEQSESYLADLSARVGLPCVDPLRTGTAKIIDYINQQGMT
ncbi:MAG: DUF1611 domain-containing protein [Alphaproteobacteria bacterium]|nr:DUF1611 domain-containing protein [Alphaproteobacteria bacterium]